MAALVGGSFMETPLVLWVQTFSAESLGYKDFVDGLFLNNNIMKQIDGKAITDGVVANPEDMNDRMHNWDTLLQNIKTYYQEVLQQLIVMKLPNIVTISRQPESGEAQTEIQRLLLLLLGCAIQCEKKEMFIDNIKRLPINTQHAIVDFIKNITDDSKNVFSIELPSQHANQVAVTMHRHLCSLVDERDGYMMEIKDLNQTLEEMAQSQQVLQAQRGLVVSPAGSPEKQEKQHLIMELAESKAKSRKLRQQLEEKTELAAELQEEIEELKMNLSKLRNENLQLTQDARAARTYRDELDIVREKANRVEKIESEISKYKEKLNELDFYKTRVEELREENALMTDAKNLLEDQLEASHRRIASVHDLENSLARSEQRLRDMTAQRDEAQEQLMEVVEENARLELEKRSSFNESVSLEEELSQARLQMAPSGVSNSLSEQLHERANAKMLRLELENQRLQKQIVETRDSVGAGENNATVMELEKENHRLGRKVESLQRGTSQHSQDYIELEQANHEVISERAKLQQTIETIRASNERETLELEREKEQLERTVATLRQRNEKTHDLRMKDLETENKALDEKVRESGAKLSRVTFELRQMAKSYEYLQSSLGKMEDVEGELHSMRREKDELNKSVVTMQLTCDRYEELERDNSDLEVEKMRLAKVVEGLTSAVARLKTVEQDNINLTVESAQLRRSVENMKAVANSVVDLEHERGELKSEIETMNRVLESVKIDQAKQDDLHAEIMNVTGVNQKLLRSVEAQSLRLEHAERESHTLESQNQALGHTVEEMRASLHRLDMLERENADLEVECAGLQREKAVLEKDKKRLGQQVETKAVLLDEATETAEERQRQNKALRKAVGRTEDCTGRLREVEQENVTLIQQASTERKTVATLREDLVNEKIKTQLLSNELDNLTEELEKVGLNKEKIIAMEQAEDESKYKALESMMEETFQRSMQLKEEKICALQSRLDASRKHNQKLQEDLKAVRHQYEALQQRREEEASGGNSPKRDKSSLSVSSSRDVFQLKDHVIAVERANAALEAENNHLKSHIDDLQSRLDNTETRCVKLQMQVSSMQGQHSSQQTQLARLQVEVTTLQSQNASLASQNAVLQKQVAGVEGERSELVAHQEELQSAHESLVVDHDALQRLHETLSAEYEALISEHGSLKANHKSLRGEHRGLQEREMTMERERLSVNDTRKRLALEQEHLQTEARSNTSEFARLAEDKTRLEKSHKALSVDYSDEVAAHKATKMQLNQVTVKHDQLQTTHADTENQLMALEFEVSKLVNKCETMDLLNNKLEDENRTLMMQLQALLTQNQELLTQSLDSKDHFHEEQRGYLEKLAELRRQKEKLEEKIMEQYKRYDPVKRKSRGFGANLVRKAKGMMGRRSHSRENMRGLSVMESGPHNSPENSSLGSGSVGESDGHTDSIYNNKNAGKRTSRHRRNNRSDSPKLAKQNKALAKSTNALAASRKDATSHGFSLRGAKSSENLLDGDEFSRAGSLSSSNSSAQQAEWPTRQGKRRQLLGSTSSGPMGKWQEASGQKGFDKRYRARQSSASSDDNGQQDDNDDLLTLDQFLSECNRSPTSRRKWLQSTGDLHGGSETRADMCPTNVLSPELGPRPAVPQTEATTRPLSRCATASDTSGSDHKGHIRTSHSELNISKLSQISSPMSVKQTSVTSGGGGGGRSAPWHQSAGKSTGPPDVKTSTPNRNQSYMLVDVSANGRDGVGMQPVIQGGCMSQSHSVDNGQWQFSNHPVPTSDSFHSDMMSNAAYVDMNAASCGSSVEYSNGRGVVAGQQNGQRLPRQSSSVSSLQRMGSMRRQDSGGITRPQPQLFGSNNGGGGVKRQMSCNNSGNNTLPLRGTSMHYDAAVYSKGQGSPDVSIYATTPRRSATPLMSNPEPLDSNDDDGASYHPGNVRNLVQSYQQTVHQQLTTPEGPVPPPRRTRPLSAGPGSGSAFTDPVPPSHQRPFTPNIPSTELFPRRTLPQPPDGSAVPIRRLSSPPTNDSRGQNAAGPSTPRLSQRGDAPGNTPPRPADPPKNSIWPISYHGTRTSR